VSKGKVQTTAWGWVRALDGAVQVQTFEDPNAAIEEMRRRQDDPKFSVEDAWRHGFRLALVRVTVEALLVLNGDLKQ
jgi:hypothetical protein